MYKHKIKAVKIQNNIKLLEEEFGKILLIYPTQFIFYTDFSIIRNYLYEGRNFLSRDSGHEKGGYISITNICPQNRIN